MQMHHCLTGVSQLRNKAKFGGEKLALMRIADFNRFGALSIDQPFRMFRE